MKVAYIAHPIGGDVEGNLAKIRKIVREINLSDPDTVPFVPYYVDCVSMFDAVPEERERGFKNNLHLLRSGLVHEIWLYGPRISAGMEIEIECAKECGIKIVSKSKDIVLSP